jgi:predicted DCC family thiol-disulfide oxidoreductase YuxK
VALTVFYDGRCSLCAGTARSLVKMDRGRGRVRVVDFRADFSEAERAGIASEALEGAMHAVHADGRVTAGPQAVRDALRAVGLGPVSAVLGWPVVGGVFGRLYDWVARNRLKWFGRGGEEEVGGGCDGGVCRVEHFGEK